MKKMKLVVVGALVAAVAIGGVFAKVNVSANESVSVEKTDDGDYSETKEISVDSFDELLPVITALSAQVYTKDSAYAPTRGWFYEDSFSYILAYLKLNNSNLVEYTEDDNNFYLDENNMYNLSTFAYHGGAVEDMSYCFDSTKGVYVIKKNDISLDYSVKVTKVTCTEGVYDGIYQYNYDLEGELYKGEEKIDDVKVSISPESVGEIGAAVHWLNLDNYGIEVVY